MQYAYSKIFHFTIQYAYLWEGKRVFSFISKPKILPINSIEHKIEDKKHFPKWFLFSESNKKGGDSLFLKEKEVAHYMDMSLYL